MEKIMVVTFVFIIFIVAPGLIWYGVKHEAEFNEACESRGGHVLRGRDLAACIDPKALR